LNHGNKKSALGMIGIHFQLQYSQHFNALRAKTVDFHLQNTNSRRNLIFDCQKPMNTDPISTPVLHSIVSDGPAMVPFAAFEDAHLLVVNKPPGLLAVPGRGPDKQDCLLHRLQDVCPDVLLVHRLDQATSGLMVFAKSLALQRALSKLFEARQVHKQYIAVARGQMAHDTGVVDLPLIADWPQRPKQKVDVVHGKPSQTRWQVLSRDSETNTTRVALEPVTGRSHQLRVHMLALGHVLVGDSLYGDAADMGGGTAANAPRRMCLHAARLTFNHPVTGTDLTFVSAPDF
jgi:tRNA pseudouridine32 synthase / 23S rRNA pseudouridine746 synthase